MSELTFPPQSGIYEFGFEHLERNYALSVVLSLSPVGNIWWEYLHECFGRQLSHRVVLNRAPDTDKHRQLR